MQFEKLAQLRYSVRKFDSRPVEERKIRSILKAAQAAPSGKNRQSWRVLVLNDRMALEKLKECTPCHYNAPLAFVVCWDRNECYVREADGWPVGPVDACIAATHMMLAACDQGIGSTWVENLNPAHLKEHFEIPEAWEIAALLVCGYPHAECRINPRHSVRKPLEELCYYNSAEKAEAAGNPQISEGGAAS